MKVRWGPVFCQVLESSEKEMTAVRTILRAHPAGYQFLPSYRKRDPYTGARKWDGYRSLITEGQAFLTGLLPYLTDQAVPYGVEVKVMGKPSGELIPNIKDDYLNDGSILRKYQLRMAKKLLKEERGIGKGATRSGKTRVMSVLCKHHADKACLILINSKDVFWQLVEKIGEQTGEKIGVICSGAGKKGGWQPERITVAMIQTLYARRATKQFKEYLKVVEVLIMDECHSASAATAYKTLKSIPARYRWGLSATPLEYDEHRNQMTTGLFGPVVDTISPAELQKHGNVAVPHIFFRTIPKRKETEAAPLPPDEGEDVDTLTESRLMRYRWAFQYGVVENRDVEKAIRKDCEWYVANKFPTLIQVDTKSHGHRLHELLSDLGAVYLDSDDPAPVRHAERKAFNAGKRPILITTPIFNLGLDFPALKAMIPVGGGHGKVKIPQRLGRGYQTKEEGPNVFFVTDFINLWDWKLTEHSLLRLKIYNGTKIAVVHRPDTPLSLEDIPT